MTYNQFVESLKRSLTKSAKFYLILKDDKGIPDETDWFGLEFDGGKRYTFRYDGLYIYEGLLFVNGVFTDLCDSLEPQFFRNIFNAAADIARENGAKVWKEEDISVDP